MKNREFILKLKKEIQHEDGHLETFSYQCVILIDSVEASDHKIQFTSKVKHNHLSADNIKFILNKKTVEEALSNTFLSYNATQFSTIQIDKLVQLGKTAESDYFTVTINCLQEANAADWKNLFERVIANNEQERDREKEVEKQNAQEMELRLIKKFVFEKAKFPNQTPRKLKAMGENCVYLHIASHYTINLNPEENIDTVLQTMKKDLSDHITKACELNGKKNVKVTVHCPLNETNNKPNNYAIYVEITGVSVDWFLALNESCDLNKKFQVDDSLFPKESKIDSLTPPSVERQTESASSQNEESKEGTENKEEDSQSAKSFSLDQLQSFLTKRIERLSDYASDYRKANQLPNEPRFTFAYLFKAHGMIGLRRANHHCLDFTSKFKKTLNTDIQRHLTKHNIADTSHISVKDFNNVLIDCLKELKLTAMYNVIELKKAGSNLYEHSYATYVMRYALELEKIIADLELDPNKNCIDQEWKKCEDFHTGNQITDESNIENQFNTFVETFKKLNLTSNHRNPL